MAVRKGMGWERDLPDFRDLTHQSLVVSKSLTALAKKQKKTAKKSSSAPPTVDLREWCPDIEDQGDLGSCTANAGVGLFEYFQLHRHGKYLDGSRLFLYKATRNLLGWTGDEGAYLRTTMKAMALFGVPPEPYYPYDIGRFDDEPPAFCYAFAKNYQAIKYYRLDQPGISTAKTLAAVKQSLANEIPAMFGFTVYSSIPPIGDGKGEIPFPKRGDSVEGGHAVVAVGYKDNKKIGKHTGALLIRNSWGKEWGEHGYGWLPYAYVEHGLAVDFWSLVESEFTDTDEFEEE